MYIDRIDSIRQKKLKNIGGPTPNNGMVMHVC